ncbi:MAG: TetR/AcrR family transcriptional regulator [Ilumatobacteraceae bacterium]
MAIEGARARARAAVIAELTAEARRQLAEVGPAALSLRSVARAAGMVSSGVYRYFASRDELLTALIVESYDELGAAAERAANRHARKPPLDRWLATCRAVRRWGVDHPHEWALVYGSPVPGYEAPLDTIVPAQRVTRTLVGVVADAACRGGLRTPVAGAEAVPAKLAAELEQINDVIGVEVVLTTDDLVRLLTAWSQVFGMISLELFGQTAGAITAHEALFDATARTSGRLVGLRGR